MSEIRPVGRCRVCGSTKLTFLFSLGDHYVNDFVEPGKHLDGVRCPIELELCENCTLVQLRHTAPQDFLYTRHYWYRSGVNEAMREDLRLAASDAITHVPKLEEGDVFLDIGSNDGTMLRHVPNTLTRVGVEPALNLAEEGAKGIDVFINDFWSNEVYERAVGRKAKIITAFGMFYDLDDPNAFIADVANALHEDGVFIAQLMCLQNMLDMGDVGNLAHEHLEFYSLRSLDYLLGRNGLSIYGVSMNSTNGKSYRLYCCHAKHLDRFKDRHYVDSVKQYRLRETQLIDPDTYARWFRAVESNKHECVDYIDEQRKKGKRVWVYGASTKGNTILQYYGLDNTIIEAAADRSPGKWGKVTIGTGIPIVSEEDARHASPDYFLVLPYAFINSFIQRERAWIQRGGRFIVPLPKFGVI